MQNKSIYSCKNIDKKSGLQKIVQKYLFPKFCLNILKCMQIKISLPISLILKGTQAWNFCLTFLQKPNPYGPKGL
jgi:hypothetical protein